MRKLTLLSVLAVAFMGLTAQAQEQAEPIIKATKDSYGLAGCGLGSMIFGAQPGFVQVFAATTNATAANQTFGITTGTLNCNLAEAGLQAAVYIESNREVIVKDVARGSGETLVGLANLMNCSNQMEFNRAAQSNLEKIFMSSDNAYTNVQNLYEVIQTNPVLTSSCNIEG